MREQRKRGGEMVQLQGKGNEEITVEGKCKSQGGGGGMVMGGEGRRFEAMRHFFVWVFSYNFCVGYFCGFYEDKE